MTIACSSRAGLLKWRPAETGDNWLDIIPMILLVRGVPVTDRDGKRGVLVSADRVSPYRIYREGVCYGTEAADETWRPDLADPQGFGYALRWLTQQYKGGAISAFLAALRLNDEEELEGFAWRHWIGTTTDADRVALAKALREVAS